MRPRSARIAFPSSQRGLTMFVAMIILVMVTLLAVSAFRVSNTNLKVVASMQGRQEAIGSAQAAIEEVMSSPKFAEDPTGIAATPINVDINNDGTADFTVTINPAPKCIRTRPTSPKDLDLTKIADRNCLGSARVAAGMLSSFCSDTIWEISANTTDKLTAATTTVRQGVALRVAATDATTSCK